MKTTIPKSTLFSGFNYLGTAALLIGGSLFGAHPGMAQNSTGAGNFCVQTNLGVNKLNCTANDTNNRISQVLNVSPAECEADAFFDLTATFVLSTNASERYDASLTFSSDGDPNGDGAKTGICSRAIFLPGEAENLDSDACGDVTSVGSPYELTVTNLTVKCVDTDDDGFVNLPHIISWNHNGDSTDCQSAVDALPGTTSKCIVDDTFNIPVRLRQPGGDLSKTATAIVRYDIVVNNTGETDLTLQELIDDIYGDILDPSNTNILSTDCVDNTVIPWDPVPPATPSYSCHFKVFFDLNNPGSATAVTDTVHASGVDENDTAWGGPGSSFEDDATVTVHIQ
jgi:hypothetical protein